MIKTDPIDTRLVGSSRLHRSLPTLILLLMTAGCAPRYAVLLNKLEIPAEANLRWKSGFAFQIRLPPSGNFTVSSEMKDLPRTIEVLLPDGRNEVVELELFEVGSVGNQIGWKITPAGVMPLYFGELAAEPRPGASFTPGASQGPLPPTKLRHSDDGSSLFHFPPEMRVTLGPPSNPLHLTSAYGVRR